MMGLFRDLFGIPEPAHVELEPEEPQEVQRFTTEAILADVDSAHGLLMKESTEVSPVVFSTIRGILHRISKAIINAEGIELPHEDYRVFHDMLTKHIPDSLRAFSALPDEDREAGKLADMLLIEQLMIMSEKADRHIARTKDSIVSQLQTQAVFVGENFAN